MEEMVIAESNMDVRRKVELKLISKQEQIKILRSILDNFRNDKLKTKVAEFLSWLNFILNPVASFDMKFPSDLKKNLADISRYEGDISVMAEDVNIKFKYMK